MAIEDTNRVEAGIDIDVIINDKEFQQFAERVNGGITVPVGFSEKEVQNVITAMQKVVNNSQKSEGIQIINSNDAKNAAIAIKSIIKETIADTQDAYSKLTSETAKKGKADQNIISELSGKLKTNFEFMRRLSADFLPIFKEFGNFKIDNQEIGVDNLYNDLTKAAKAAEVLVAQTEKLQKYKNMKNSGGEIDDVTKQIYQDAIKNIGAKYETKQKYMRTNKQYDWSNKEQVSSDYSELAEMENVLRYLMAKINVQELALDNGKKISLKKFDVAKFGATNQPGIWNKVEDTNDFKLIDEKIEKEFENSNRIFKYIQDSLINKQEEIVQHLAENNKELQNNLDKYSSDEDIIKPKTKKSEILDDEKKKTDKNKIMQRIAELNKQRLMGNKSVSEIKNELNSIIQEYQKFADTYESSENATFDNELSEEVDKLETDLKNITNMYNRGVTKEKINPKDAIVSLHSEIQKFHDLFYDLPENSGITEQQQILDDIKQIYNNVKDSIPQAEQKQIENDIADIQIMYNNSIIESLDDYKELLDLEERYQNTKLFAKENNDIEQLENARTLLEEIKHKKEEVEQIAISNGVDSDAMDSYSEDYFSNEEQKLTNLETKINNIKNDVKQVGETFKETAVDSENFNKSLDDNHNNTEQENKALSFKQKRLEKFNKIDNIDKFVEYAEFYINQYDGCLEELDRYINESANLSGDELKTKQKDIESDKKELSDTQDLMVGLYIALNNFINNVGEVSDIDKEAITQISDKFNERGLLPDLNFDKEVNNATKVSEAVNVPSDSTTSQTPTSTTNATISDNTPDQIQKQLDAFGFTIYITRALLSDSFSSEELQSQLDKTLATNPIRVDFTPKFTQSDTEEPAQPNSLSVSISNIDFANADVVADIKSKIEVALSPIVINSVEISQENIGSIKEQITNALNSFTIDKIEPNFNVDIESIITQINETFAMVKMPVLDYSENAVALKTELENALSQVTMSEGSISRLIPDNTVNDLDTINKISDALKRLQDILKKINKAIRNVSKTIDEKNSGIVSNVETDISKINDLTEQVEKLKETIDSIGNIENIVVTIQNKQFSPVSPKEGNSGKDDNSDNTDNNTPAPKSENYDDYYTAIESKISEINKAVSGKQIDKDFAKKYIVWLNNLKKGVISIEKGKEDVTYQKPKDNGRFEQLPLDIHNINQVLEDAYKEIDLSVKNKTIESFPDVIRKDIEDINKSKAKIGTQSSDEYLAILKSFQKGFDEFKDGKETATFNVFDENGEIQKEVLDITQALEKYKTVIDKIRDTKVDATAGLSLSKMERNYNNLITKAKKWGEENSRALKDKNLASQYNNILEELADTTDMSAEKIEKLTARFNSLEAQTVSAGKTGRSFGNEMKHLFEILGNRAIVGAGLEYIKQAFREMLNNTREIDAAMTELKKVTDNSGETYSRFLKNAGTQAQALGSTITALTTSTAGFAKLGYNINESQTLAENAIMYSNVGDLDIETATNDLVSATKAFNLSAEETGRIVDSFNEVGNRFAVSARQLGEGLTNSASTLYMSGNSMDESIAMLTAMTEVTQDASSAGAALKIYALRLRGAKTELNELGEDTSDMATSTSKLRAEIKGLTGVDIMFNDSTFKSTMQITKELSEAMEKMNDIDKTALLEKIAGKNRANQIGALLNNFSQAEKALEVSENAAGSAAKENAAYIDSIQGRINQMKAAFEDLSIDFFDSDDIKLVVKGLTKVIELVDKIVEVTGGTPLLSLGLMGFLDKNETYNFANFFSDIQKVPTVLAEVGSKIKNSSFGQFMEKDWEQTKEDVTQVVGAIKTGVSALKGEDISNAFSLTGLKDDMGTENNNSNTIQQTNNELILLAKNFKNAFIEGLGGAVNATKNIDNIREAVAKKLQGVVGDSENAADKINEALAAAFEDGEEGTEKVAEGMEAIGKGAENASEATSKLAASFKALAAQLLIAAAIWAVTEIVESIETVEKLQEKVEEAAESYNEVTNKLEDVTDKLEENKKLIEEINANPLTITSKEDLERLKEENALLEIQKRGLALEEETKKSELAKTSTQFLNKIGYEYSAENGVKENNWFGQDTYLEAVNKALNNFEKNVDDIQKIDFSKDANSALETYASLIGSIEQQETQFSHILSTLSEQQGYLYESSDLYKEISATMSNILDTQEKFSKFNSNSYAAKAITAYAEQDAMFIDNLNDYYKIIKGFDEINAPFTTINDLNFEKIDDNIKKLFEDNKIILQQDLEDPNGTYLNAETVTYEKVLDIYKRIIQLKHEGLITDTEDNLRLEEGLKTLLGFQDISLSNMRKILDVATLSENADTVNDFFLWSGDDTNSNPFKNKNLSDINAANFFDFRTLLTEYMNEQGKDPAFIEDYLLSVFPSYQDINNWLEAYYNEGNIDQVDQLIEKALSGGLNDVDWELGEYSSITTALKEILDVDNIKDIDIEDLVAIFIKQLNDRINKQLSENHIELQELNLSFNQKKSDYDDNAKSIVSVFDNAISAALAGDTNQATISSEDMWTMIQADESLAIDFKDAVDNCTVSVDTLRAAKERYIAAQKSGFETDRQTALKAKAEAEKEMEEAQKILDSTTTTNEEKAVARQNKQEAQKQISEADIQLAKYDLMIEEIDNQTVNLADTIDDITSKLSNWESIYQSILNDMTKIGKLSASTLQAIMKAVPDWEKYVSLDENGQLQVDKEGLFNYANQDLRNSNQEKINTLKSNLANQITAAFKDKYNLNLGVDFELTDDYEQNIENITNAINSSLGSLDLWQTSAVRGGNQINETLEELTPNIEEATEEAKLLYAVLNALFGEFEENQALAEFNAGIEELQHSLSMGYINQAQYNSAYAGKVSKFESDVYANGTVDDPEVKDQLNHMYETIHTNQQNELQKQFEKEKQSIQDAYDQHLITAEKYYHDLAELEDRYYGTRASENSGLVSIEDIENLRKFNEEMQKTYGLGNVDLTIRPKVDSSAMKKAGYDVADGETATVYSSTEFLWQGDEKNGKYVAVHYTPILPDGTVLDEKTLSDYIYGTLESADNILEADKNNLGIVLKVDTDLNITEDDINSLQTDKPTQNIQNIIKTCDEWDVSLHDVQEQWMSLSDAVENTPLKTDTKGLLDDPDGTNIDDKIREQIERRKQIYESEKALLQEKYDRGYIDFAQFESDLNTLQSYWLNLPELKVTFDEETYANTNILYEAEVAEIEKLGEQHKLSETQVAAELRRVWEKYYKDKTGFAEESYEAEKRYLEAAKNDIQSQINGIQDLMDINEKFINEQIEIIEKENEEITKSYDEQIDLINEQIDAIDEKINAIKSAADEEERLYNLQKAEEELKNASQRTRMVYGADGTVTYRTDNEKYKEALKNYNDAKRELVTAELEKQKEEKEKEKEGLEEAKSEALETNNEKIEDLNKTLAEMNDPLEDLVTVLSANLAETYGIDPEVIKEALKTDASKLALEQLNKPREAQGGETTTAEDLANAGEEASKEYKNQTVSQDTKDEQIKKVNENVTAEKKDNNEPKESVTVEQKDNNEQTDETSEQVTETVDNIVKVGEGLYTVLSDLPLNEINSNLAALLTSNVKLPDGLATFTTDSNTKLNNTIDPKLGTEGTETAVTSQTNTFKIGDIVINSPVGSSNDLAKELRLNLQNAFEKQI
ncbi:MAG: phage tail tape measure protein [Alistipes senegalensis]|nr:phage tail tape measure protein [Alistipes senegalensis]